MIRLLLGLAAFAALGLAAGPAAAQVVNPTVGTYQYYFTDLAGQEITSVNAALGSNVTVQVRLRESAGNVFSTRGVIGYDAQFTFNPALLALPTTGGAGSANNTTAFRLNLYPTDNNGNPTGFSGSGTFTNDETATANTAGTGRVAKNVPFDNINDPLNWSASFLPPPAAPNLNAATELALFNLTLTATAAGTSNLTVGDGIGAQNFGYDQATAGGQVTQFLDPGTNGTNPFATFGLGTLSIVVPVPEPATALGVAALALAGLRAARRRAVTA